MTNKDDEALLQFFGMAKSPLQPAPQPKPAVMVGSATVVKLSPEEQRIVEAADRYLKGEPTKTAVPQPQLKVIQKSGATWKELSGWVAAVFSWALFTVYLLLGVIRH